jgi:hypothetical protein
MTADGLPLGLLHLHAWGRDPAHRGQRKDRRGKETADKESQRWLDAEAACVAALPADRALVTVADREADFYDLFAVARRPGQDILVRAKLRRRIQGDKRLLGMAVRDGAVAGTFRVTVPRKDGKPGREATVAIRFGQFAIQPPSTHPRRKELRPVPLRAILVEEVDPPAKATPLCWLLLTTLTVDDAEAAVRAVRWYALRWRIERFHFTLKSGCKVEELQLETAVRLRRALSVCAMVAARLLHLTYKARVEPRASCVPSLSGEEWEVLWRHFRPGVPLPPAPPDLRQALRWVAQLGGFLARVRDGEPGVKVLWRGLRRLHAMVEGFRLARAPDTTVQSSD